MAQEKAESELNLEDLHGIHARAGPEEKRLMRDLVNSDQPEQGMVLAKLLHYFPGATLITSDDDKRLRPPKRPTARKRRS